MAKEKTKHEVFFQTSELILMLVLIIAIIAFLSTLN